MPRAPVAGGMERIPDVSMRRAVPVEGVTSAPDGAGTALRRRRFAGLRAGLARMSGVSPFRILRLDPLSSEAWSLMDGRRTVGEVLGSLQRAHPGEDDLGPRLGRLVGLLVSNGFLRLE